MTTIFIRRRPDTVMEWTLEEVAEWLRELKLDKHCKRFQSHLVSGAVLLQMDDILLDDLNITHIEERELLLKESRKLCLQELDIVNHALKQKQKSKEDPTQMDQSTLESMAFSGSAGFEWSTGLDGSVSENQLFQENQQALNTRGQQESHINAKLSSDADEVATRATEMVAMLSQENADLRKKMEEYLQDRYELQMLREEVAKLHTTNVNLINEVTRYSDDNVKLVSDINQLRHDYHELEDTLNQQKIDKQQYEDQIETLKRNNRSVRDKYQRLKFKTVEREMARNASANVYSQVTSNDFRSLAKNSPRRVHNGPISNDKTPTNLQLIEKVYQANKRCAELEDTVRWLSGTLLMESNRNLHHEKHLVHEPSIEHDGPREPDWPSLKVTKIPPPTTTHHSSLYDDNKTTPDVLQHLISRGLPTDNDSDIWRTQDGTDAVLIQQRETLQCKYYRTSNA